MKALILRPTGLGAGMDEDRLDYTIYSGGWVVRPGCSEARGGLPCAAVRPREGVVLAARARAVAGRVGLLSRGTISAESVSRPRQRKTIAVASVELCSEAQGAHCGSVRGT